MQYAIINADDEFGQKLNCGVKSIDSKFMHIQIIKIHLLAEVPTIVAKDIKIRC